MSHIIFVLVGFAIGAAVTGTVVSAYLIHKFTNEFRQFETQQIKFDEKVTETNDSIIDVMHSINNGDTDDSARTWDAIRVMTKEIRNVRDNK